MIVKSITYFDQPATLVCDAQCDKAWGTSSRPRIYVDDPEQQVINVGDHRYPERLQELLGPKTDWLDNHVELADGELGVAPDDPGTYEGGHAKPHVPSERLNKWCARECERCLIVEDNEDFELRDYSVRQYNVVGHK